MKKLTFVLCMSMTALVGGAVLSRVASAQTVAQSAIAQPAVVKRGVTLRTVDGHRVGIIEDLQVKDGVPVTAQIVLESHIIYVPISTITTDSSAHYITSLTYKQINAL